MTLDKEQIEQGILKIKPSSLNRLESLKLTIGFDSSYQPVLSSPLNISIFQSNGMFISDFSLDIQSSAEWPVALTRRTLMVALLAIFISLWFAYMFKILISKRSRDQ